jgi:hypothetical protein
MRLLLFCWILLPSLVLSAQKKTEIIDFSDTIFQNFDKKVIRDVDIRSRYQRAVVLPDTVSKTIRFLFLEKNEKRGKHFKIVETNEAYDIVSEKEVSATVRSGKIDPTAIIDCGDRLAIFSVDDFFMEEINISKLDGSVTKHKQHQPTMVSQKRFFKHQNKLYFFTFDTQMYYLYELVHGRIKNIGRATMPEIPKFELAQKMREAAYLRDFKPLEFGETQENNNIFTINNKLIFTFANIQRGTADFLTLSFDLTSGELSKTVRKYPSVSPIEKTKDYKFGSFISSDGKVFLASISENDFVLSIQNLDNTDELKRIVCNKQQGFAFKNSIIYGDQSNLNFWSGKEQRKSAYEVSDLALWDKIFDKGLSIMAIPTNQNDEGYDIIFGSYTHKEVDEDGILAAGVLFGLIGATIAAGVAAEKGGTDTQYFYSRLNDKFEPVPDVILKLFKLSLIC